LSRTTGEIIAVAGFIGQAGWLCAQ